MRSYACIVIAAAACVGGCASSGARTAAGAAPVVVVGDAVKADKERLVAAPVAAKVAAIGARDDLADQLGAALNASGLDLPEEGGVEGGVVGGVLGGVGGLGTGYGGLGGTAQGIGIGSIGTLGHGSGGGSGMIGVLSGSGEGFGGIGLRGIGMGGGARAKPRIEEATVTGTLTREVVQRVALEHLQDVQDCYALEAVRSSPRGRITLAFTIDGAGRVTEVRVPESGSGMRDLPACVAQVLGTWKFPPPAGGSEVKVILPVSI